jgi:hypothetical protein
VTTTRRTVGSLERPVRRLWREPDRVGQRPAEGKRGRTCCEGDRRSVRNVPVGETLSACVAALAGHGIHAHGCSGLGVWAPVPEEVPVVQQLLENGWAVSAGERYRFRTAPGIRITTSGLETDDAGKLDEVVAAALESSAGTYAG